MNSETPSGSDVRELVREALAIDQQLSTSDPAEFIRRRNALLEALMTQAGEHEERLHRLQEQIDHSGAVNPSPQQAVQSLLLALQDRLSLLNRLFAELDTLTRQLGEEQRKQP